MVISKLDLTFFSPQLYGVGFRGIMQRLSCISYMMVQFEKELKTVNTADPKSKETLEHVRDTMLTYYIQAKTAMENIPHIKIEPIEE